MTHYGSEPMSIHAIVRVLGHGQCDGGVNSEPIIHVARPKNSWDLK